MAGSTTSELPTTMITIQRARQKSGPSFPACQTNSVAACTYTGLRRPVRRLSFGESDLPVNVAPARCDAPSHALRPSA
jgi:hypothetical protein